MKEMNRRAFLKLSGASAVMLALAGFEDEGFGGSGAPETPDSGSSIAPSTYDPFYSEEITTLGPPLPEAPDSPPIPVIRDGRKIFEIINAELTRRKVQYFKLQYNAGLEHSIQSEMQMFVDYDTPSFSAEEGLEARMNGDYVDIAQENIERGFLMNKLLSCRYNMDTNRVEARFEGGTPLSIDCIAVEDEYGNTPAQRAEPDWLLYNKPLEYAPMVLSGEIEHYLSLGCDHGRLEDQ